MDRETAVTALILAATGAGCGVRYGQPRPGAATPAIQADTTVQGVVAVTGADPFAQVVVTAAAGGAGAEVAVLGPLRGELAALQGAEVRVRGRLVNNGQPVPPRAVEVTSYEIVTINGEKPIVGELVARDDGLWLGGERLTGVPVELRQAVGAKVWVVGRRTNGEWLVLSYGIIARPRR